MEQWKAKFINTYQFFVDSEIRKNCGAAVLWNSHAQRIMKVEARLRKRTFCPY